MSVPVIAFFNNKGGVGMTSLAYHLSWMFVDMGYRVVAADLDPQANLSSAFLDDNKMEEIWEDRESSRTIYKCIQPLKDGYGDIKAPILEEIDYQLALIVGDLELSLYEDDLTAQWPDCLDRKPRAFRVISSLWRIIQSGAEQFGAQLVLMDLGPNLGAINRAALISSDWIVIPLAPDLYSIQGLNNLGPTLRRWREEWEERKARNTESALQIPEGRMQPLGYIVLQHTERLDRPVKAYRKWIERIPHTFHTAVLNENYNPEITIVNDDKRLAYIKHFHSMFPMAQEARKPIFHLKPADGAIGSHVYLVQKAEEDFRNLAQIIAERIGLQKID